MKELNVLMYALHPDPSGFIGGGFVRTYELLKRGKKHGINYIVVETKKNFKHIYNDMDYECYEIDCDLDFYSPRSNIECIAKALRCGLKLAKLYDIDLVYSPVEVNPSSYLPFLTFCYTSLPWTIMLQFAPLYGTMIATQKSDYNFTSFRGLYSHLKLDRGFSAVISLTAAMNYWFLYKMVLRKAPVLLAISEPIANDLGVIDMDIYKKLYTVWPGNGIDYNYFERLSEEEKIYDAVFPASYDPKKGLWDVIKTWSLVVKQRPESKLAIVGCLGETEQAKKTLYILNEEITRRGLKRNVFLHENLLKGISKKEEFFAQLKKARILLYPSLLDGWGLIVSEALACGLTVVAYDIPAFRVAFKNCPAIAYAPVGDVKRLAENTLSLIKYDSYQKESCLAAREYMENYYSWDSVVQAEKAAYIEVIKKW